MNDATLKLIAAAFAAIALRNSAEIKELQAAAQAFLDTITAELPRKPDGTPWTDEDVTIAYQRSDVPWNIVEDVANKALGAAGGKD